MTLPDLRSLSPLQILACVLFLAAVVGMAVSGRRRANSGSGVGVAVWLMIPLVLVVCALGIWMLSGSLKISMAGFIGPP